MKIYGFVVIMVAVAFAFAPAKLTAQDHYAVKLTSPVAGQVLYTWPQITGEGKHRLPTSPWRGVRARFGCLRIAAEPSPRMRSSPRRVHLCSGKVRTRF